MYTRYEDGTGKVLKKLTVNPGRLVNTVCPRSSDPFHIVSYIIKWVTTSWTYSII